MMWCLNMPGNCLAVLLGSLLCTSVAWADLLCDGVDDTAVTAVQASDMLSGSAGTLMAWIKPTGSPSGTECWNGQIITGPNESEALLGMQSGTLACGFTYDGVTSNWAEAASTSGQWMHLAMTYSGGTLRLYKNGLEVDTATTGTINYGSTPARLCTGAYSSPYQGRLGPVRYYNVALSANELASIGGSRLLRVGTTAAQGTWPLDTCSEGTSGDAVTFPDRSGNNRPFTGDNGANTTGLTCGASEYLAVDGGGVQ